MPTPLAWLVTGGTGLVGRRVVEHLLRRGEAVTLLVRPASLAHRAETLDALRALAAAQGAALAVLPGDVEAPGLGLAADAPPPAAYDHVVHAAARYDLDASDTACERANVDGTRHLLGWLADGGFAGVLHHVSSIAVAGDKAGRFREDDLDVGQAFPHPYLRTKHAAERLVRDAAKSGLRVRIYRPSAVVGDSRTGETDKADGPYYVFPALKAARAWLPRWFPVLGWIDGRLNMVPVDWVAAVIDHLAHADGLDGRTFHVVDPAPPRVQETWNHLADVAGAPRMRFTLGRDLRALAPGLAQTLGQLGALRTLREAFLEDLGVPVSALDALNTAARFDTTHLRAALAGADLPCPPQASYARPLWEYWETHLDPDRDPAGRRRAAVQGRTLLVTGASSGIGEALAVAAGALGAKVLLVARRADALEAVAAKVREAGGEAAVYPCDLTDHGAIDRLVEQVLADHGGLDVLVNNAGHSIRRPALASLERFHDYERLMQLNYLGPVRLVRGFLPAMLARGRGHVVNVLSAGAVLPTPNFSAYGASKAALGHFTDTLAAEHMDQGVSFTGVYLPWVRTPMMDATGRFKDTDAMTPDKAATWILDGVAHRRRHVLDPASRRRWVMNGLAPTLLTRLVNIAHRIDADEPERFPRYALDRTLLRRVLKGRLM